MANDVMLSPQPASTALMHAPPAEMRSDIARLQRWFRAFETNKEREQEEQREHRRYYHGKQWTPDEVKKLKKRGQAPIFDNRIARKVDFLVGVEQRMRRDPKAFPRTPKEDNGADAATAGLRYACDLNRWEQIASDCMADGLISATGVVFVGIEPGRSGLEPKIKGVQADRYFYDPRSVRPDFSDARYMGLHLWLDIDEAKEKYPKASGSFDKTLTASRGTIGIRSEQDHEQSWGDFEHRRVRVIEFWEKKLVSKPMPQDQMMMTTAMTHPEMVVGWSFTFFCGDDILDEGVSPYLDEAGIPDCPYVAWSPYVDELGDRYGPIRNMKPLQDEVNHRRSKFLHLLNNKQLYIRKGSIDDIDELRRQIARPDGIIEHDGEWGSSTGIVDHTQDIKGQAELLAQSQSSLENLGPNPGLIGKGGGVADQSGRAILAQRDSGMTELSPIFERARDWKLRVYRKLWCRIRQSWTAEKWIRITDDERSPQFIGLNQYGMHPETGQAMSQNVLADLDVDIIMEEGPDTITMNEELMQTFSQLGAAAMGPLGKIMIELSNTPQKERLLKMMDDVNKPDPAIAAMQQRMGQVEELLSAAKVDDLIAATEAKRAGTLSTLMTSFTPQAQPTNEFGQATGPAPQAPDLATALEVMKAFPLHYGTPSLEEMHMMAGGQQGGAPPDQQGPQQGQAPQMPPPNGLMPQQNALGPEMLSPHGGLPVDPQLAS